MTRTGKIHFARLDKSSRLTSFLNFLRLHPNATTREIQIGAEVLNPNSAAAELRALGYTVDCRFDRVTDTGRRIHRYSLLDATSAD